MQELSKNENYFHDEIKGTLNDALVAYRGFKQSAIIVQFCSLIALNTCAATGFAEIIAV